ncbi:MAG: hypothetical protein KY468_03410 [Armatimonadetes bacterium]|nr:hypothetical protein [Armatimonadota bacterium]
MRHNGLRAGVLLATTILTGAASYNTGNTEAPMATGFSGWQMAYGGMADFPAFSYKGHPSEYRLAPPIPPADKPGFTPAPSVETLHYVRIPSRLCTETGRTCGGAGDFTFFQTFLQIPADEPLETLALEFTRDPNDPPRQPYAVDDGVRVTVFNSLHPEGEVAGYVSFPGRGGNSVDLRQLVAQGEINRVVLTHVDDCCEHSVVSRAEFKLNSQPLPMLIP